ncbi:MAG: iron-sulfur cluster assembly scaffold protein [Spirochaetia bacterium]|jgi:nitrogen fixation NifU-like protein|nr:iron-sulfur cluster assembly scaffold protein [Spirochaetia bacterium]
MSDSFMNDWVYTDIVKDHFMNPRNIWKREEHFEPDGVGEVGSLACGDQMRIGIQVKDDKIVKLRWLTYGCASAIASTSMMSEMATGMSLGEAYRITPDMVTKALGGLPEHKFHCSVLGDKALRAAIDDYLAKQGRENTLKTSVARVMCECKNVTDQAIETLVASGKVRTLKELQDLTGYGTGCGKCKQKIADYFYEMMHVHGKEVAEE